MDWRQTVLVSQGWGTYRNHRWLLEEEQIHNLECLNYSQFRITAKSEV